MNPKDFVIRQATTEQDIKQCMDVRREVFIDEQGYSPDIEIDDPEDTDCAHFICLSPSGEAAGTVRLHMSKAKLSRLAIRKSYRGLGLGRPLCLAPLGHMKTLGGTEVIADVQADDKTVDAIGFYLKAGFVPRGPPWTKLGVNHQLMVYDLAKLPDLTM